MEPLADVIVIGAGLSGLACADALLAADPALKVVVLEGDDRVGGRTRSDVMGLPDGRSVVVDSGGMWVGPHHTQMHSLLKRFGLQPVTQFDDGKHILVAGEEQWKAYKGDIPPHSVLSLIELQFRVLWHVDSLAASVNLDDPEQTPNALQLDSESAASYFDRLLWSQAARDTVNLVCLATLGCEASQTSMLYLLAYVKACEGMRALVDVRGGAQEARIVGGSQQVSKALAASVSSKAVVHLNAKVVEIVQHAGTNAGENLLVRVADGRRFPARTVVSAAIPSVLLRQVTFSPRLPSRLEQFAARTFRGGYAKAILVYKEPWWRAEGFSGFCTNTRADKEHCVSFMYDYQAYVVDSTTESVPALVCFFCGDVSVQMADVSEDARRASVIASVQLMFPTFKDKVASPVLYHEYLWHKDSSAAMGCPVTVFPTGQYRKYNCASVLGTPLGSTENPNQPLLFFASTDVSTEWTGYMEGAVRQGIKVAAQVSEALKSAKSGAKPAQPKTKQGQGHDEVAEWCQVGRTGE